MGQGPGAEAQDLTWACLQVVPRQPNPSASRAYADACSPGWGLPGAKTQ